jgi:hypothetical protein
MLKVSRSLYSLSECPSMKTFTCLIHRGIDPQVGGTLHSYSGDRKFRRQSGDLSVMVEVLHDFSQIFQVDAGMVPLIRSFLLQFIIH